MDRILDDIKRQFSNISAQFGPVVIFPALVTGINEDDTIRVQLGEIEIDDVRLRSIVKSGNKVILEPTPGSVVQIARVENSQEYIVIAISEVSRIVYVIDSCKMTLDETGLLVKKGSENLQKLFVTLIDAMLSEKHTTQFGPTISLTPESQLKYNQLKDRFKNIFQDA